MEEKLEGFEKLEGLGDLTSLVLCTGSLLRLETTGPDAVRPEEEEEIRNVK